MGRGRNEREEKFKLLEEVFRELGLQVRLKRVFANRWGAFLGDKFLCPFDETFWGSKSLCFFDEEPPRKGQTFEEWLASIAGSVFAGFVRALFEHVLKRLRRRLRLGGKELREFYDNCYYYIIGYFGRGLAPRIDFIRKTRKVPKWLRGLGGLPFWTDHVFYAQGDVFISEPYEMTLKDLKGLCDFCDSHGLDAKIEGFSCWFPGHTFRVMIRPRRRDEQ